MQPIHNTSNRPADADTKSPYVAPEVVDYGDANELTKGAGVNPPAGDAAPPYNS